LQVVVLHFRHSGDFEKVDYHLHRIPSFPGEHHRDPSSRYIQLDLHQDQRIEIAGELKPMTDLNLSTSRSFAAVLLDLDLSERTEVALVVEDRAGSTDRITVVIDPLQSQVVFSQVLASLGSAGLVLLGLFAGWLRFRNPGPTKDKPDDPLMVLSR